MKWRILFMCFIGGLTAMAQSPEQFNYQAVVRDASGAIQANKAVSFQFSIMQGTTTMYQETQSATTNAYGLVTLKIGMGTVVSGSMASVNWGTSANNLKVEIDPAGGSSFALLSNTQLISVPYALHAKTATHVDDADADSLNEIQVMSLMNDQLALSRNGGTVDLSGYNGNARMDSLVLKQKLDSTTAANAIIANSTAIAMDYDRDSTNELQTLTSSKDTLYLSKGGFVTFTSLITWQWNNNDLYFQAGNVAIGSQNAKMPLYIRDSIQHNSGVYTNALLIESDVTNGSGSDYTGIYSNVKGTDEYNMGVDGTSEGVSTGVNYGLGGYANRADLNIGVEAFSYGTGKVNYGLDAFAWNGTENMGVRGFARANSNNDEKHIGVQAEIQSNNGVGRALWAKSTGSRPGIGVYAESLNDSNNIGTVSYAYSSGSNHRTQTGVWGIGRGSKSNNTSGGGWHIGVRGQASASSTFVTGLVGEAFSTSTSTSAVARGVDGYSGSSSVQFSQGIFGASRSASSTGYNAGVVGLSDNHTNENVGLLAFVPGVGTLNSGVQSWVYGAATGGKRNEALYGYAEGADTNMGVRVLVSNANKVNYGVYSEANAGTSWAGYFLGNVVVSGNLSVTGSISKGSGTFKIDYPLDPENKTLTHSFVESPDMMNIYNGNAVTDANGYATVKLPVYFEAVNMDFRYQLTPVGQFAQAIISEKVKGNQFVIQTDKPNVEVSWQVTGVRNDPYAQQNRVVPLEDKSANEKGYYLHPEVYGKDQSKAIYKSVGSDNPKQRLEDKKASAISNGELRTLPEVTETAESEERPEKHTKELSK